MVTAYFPCVIWNDYFQCVCVCTYKHTHVSVFSGMHVCVCMFVCMHVIHTCIVRCVNKLLHPWKTDFPQNIFSMFNVFMFEDLIKVMKKRQKDEKYSVSFLILLTCIKINLFYGLAMQLF